MMIRYKMTFEQVSGSVKAGLAQIGGLTLDGMAHMARFYRPKTIDWKTCLQVIIAGIGLASACYIATQDPETLLSVWVCAWSGAIIAGNI